MAMLRGRGYAAVNYPTGMNLGGDPSQALVHSTTTGTFVVTLSSVDLGQGLKTVAAAVRGGDAGPAVRERSSSTPPTPTPARTAWARSPARGTHRVGNAVIMAAQRGARGDARRRPPRSSRSTPATWRPTARASSSSRAPDEKKIHICRTSRWPPTSSTAGRSPGAASSSREKSDPVPETGEMNRDSCQAHACTVAEVEVDDETGVVEVLAMHNVYEVGRALNPAMATQQIEGGAWMGVSARAVRVDRAVLPRPRAWPGATSTST